MKTLHLQQERGIFPSPPCVSTPTAKSAICSVDQKCGTTGHDTSGVRATWEFKPGIRYRKGSLAAFCVRDQLKQQTGQRPCRSAVDAADPCWNGPPITEGLAGGVGS